MLPLRDTVPAHSTPRVTLALIALIAVAFVYELTLGPRLPVFLAEHGLVPVRFFWMQETAPLDPSRFVPAITAMFLHAGWLHVLANLWFLWIFGDNVEDRLGHGRYLAFYLGSGLAVGIAQTLLFPAAAVPVVGASGAIAALLGAHLRFHPRARILTLVPRFLYLDVVEVPTLVFVAVWLVLQLVGGTEDVAAVGGALGGGTFGADVVALVAGWALAPKLAPGKRRTYPMREIFHPW